VKVIGLTGGIGSGKTTVADIFKSLGIPVFNSDLAAKKLYQDKAVLAQLKTHFGEEVMEDEELSFKKLANIIFNDKLELAWINKLIHPLVSEVFELWKSKQEGSLVLKESAILIESGAYVNCDKIITVEADEELRIERVVERDGVSFEEVKVRISKQYTDAQRREAADYVINNNGELLIPHVTELLKELK
jgi:dephospho-CoA kinase